MGRYEVLETIAVADCAIDVHGETVNDLFETAARALAETMVDPATLASTVERRVTLTAPSMDLLLFDWLSELIFLKDSEQLVFPRARVRVEDDDVWRLTARLTGGPIDPPRTTLRADPKAVTFHQSSVGPEGDGWCARVVIDI